MQLDPFSSALPRLGECNSCVPVVRALRHSRGERKARSVVKRSVKRGKEGECGAFIGHLPSASYERADVRETWAELGLEREGKRRNERLLGERTS